MDRQVHRQTDKQTDRRTNRPVHRQTNRQADRQTACVQPKSTSGNSVSHDSLSNLGEASQF